MPSPEAAIAVLVVVVMMLALYSWQTRKEAEPYASWNPYRLGPAADAELSGKLLPEVARRPGDFREKTLDRMDDEILGRVRRAPLPASPGAGADRMVRRPAFFEAARAAAYETR